jgi:hypothetical protein
MERNIIQYDSDHSSSCRQLEQKMSEQIKQAISPNPRTPKAADKEASRIKKQQDRVAKRASQQEAKNLYESMVKALTEDRNSISDTS